jgi:hypothetical protein
MAQARITLEYFAGIVGGFGLALATYPLLHRWVTPEAMPLTLAGVIIACCGGLLAIYAQRRSARLPGTPV